jgi:soluble epoxide hydrolase/lipid-phosphate phosphatase
MAITKSNKSHTVPSSGLQYSYIHFPPPPNSKKPTLLFIHGFPATSAEWSPQISHFVRLGYGILAPDCLGYGGSSKPLDVSHYVGKAMASDIISIMDAEGLQKVIGISHDWGTYLLSQLAVWHEERFEKLVFFSVPFSPPGRELNVRKINEVTKRKFGYEQYGYQIFLASEGSGKIIGDHVSLFCPTTIEKYTEVRRVKWERD